MRRLTKDDNAEARSLLQRAIDLDPQSARAFAGIAFTHNLDVMHQWSDSPERSITELHRAARRAVELDNQDAYAQMALGVAYSQLGEHDRSISALEFATQLHPGLADAYRMLGEILAFAGRSGDAIANLEKAMRLSPIYPGWFLGQLGMAYRLTGQYDEAIKALKRFRDRSPENIFSYTEPTLVYIHLGRYEEAVESFTEAAASYARAFNAEPENLELKDKIGLSHVGIGNVLLKQGKYKEASAHYKQGVKINPRLKDRDLRHRYFN